MKRTLALFLIVIFLLLSAQSIVLAEANPINLTEAERAFIEEHPVIRLGVDPEFVPFEFIDNDGQYKGITAEYLKLITERTGLVFEIEQNLTWPQAYEKALAGELDALPAVSKTQDREQHFLFSQPYHFFKRVIVTRDDDSGISGLRDLEKLTAVAVQENSSHHSYLISHPKINLSLYDSVEAALTAVANGSERAFVGNLATTNYLIKTNSLTNLKFIAFEAEEQQGIHFAVRRDWPELITILDKVFDQITEEERIAITNKWIDLETKPDYTPIIRVILFIGVLIGMVLAVSFYWILRMRKEIAIRKQIQKDLELAKQEAEAANEFKSSFMARMSHEIRTPLNAITGMAYLLKKTDTSLTQSMYIDRITQASNNMLSIINDILDFSKIEAGKVQLEDISFSMDQVIQNVVSIVSYKIEAQGIGFKLAKDPHVPNWFFGDPKRLEQILLNLLNNAAKFTEQGEVSLDLRLDAKENDRYHLSFSIHDTGIGMSKEQIESLFSPFTQADSSINRRFGGSGLGLSIVKNLVELMGGDIKVFSTLGEGSTFIVYVTLVVDRQKENDYSRSLSTRQFTNIRTLVLEKTGASMNLIESYLGSFGIHCELTSSQESAVKMLEAADGKFARPFDLFIVDYDTPQEGGFRYLRSIRENTRIAKSPRIIMLIPMMREDLFDKLATNDIDAGVGKPIIPSVLLNAIQDIFNLRAVSASHDTRQTESNNPESTNELERQYRVLLVEDNSTNQLIAKSVLKQAGIEAITAADGRIGVELFEENQGDLDLVLMDLHMPIMNGYEAAQRIRQINNSIPIVAMTADVIMDVKEKCEQSGMNDYISKPFDPEKMIDKVKLIIRSSKHSQENLPLDPPPDHENEVNESSVPAVLDQNVGLKILGGNQELYLHVLQEYYKENLTILEDLSSAIQDQDYDKAAKIVHKVKGSSGSIGATSLHETASKLQKALQNRNEQEIKPLAQTFSTLMSQLKKEIKKLL